MNTIMIDRDKHIIVFVVNIDSPNKNQVKIGNTMNPVHEPINLADQTDPVASDIGKPAPIAAAIGSSIS